MDGELFDRSWAEFIFNIKQLDVLRNCGEDTVQAVVSAGLRYAGAGWTTSRASKELFNLTGVAIVKKEFAVYRDIWLFALCTSAGVDIPSLELAQEQAEAAFAIQCVVEGRPADQDDSENEGNTEDIRFGWEEEERPLPKEFAALWNRAESSEKRIELKKLLESCPRFAGLPAKAPENNLGTCAKGRLDKFLKATQQTLLHILRLQVHEASQPSAETKLQLWQLTAEIYFKIQNERRDLSVPGLSRERAEGECLFTKEDVKAQQEEQRLQRISMTRTGGKPLSPPVAVSFRSGMSTGKGFYYNKSKGKGAWGKKGYTTSWSAKGSGRGRSWSAATTSTPRWGKGMSSSLLPLRSSPSHGGKLLGPRRSISPKCGKMSCSAKSQMSSGSISKSEKPSQMVDQMGTIPHRAGYIGRGGTRLPRRLFANSAFKSPPEETKLALEVLQEYMEAGAAQLVPWEGTKYLVPWFVIEKKDESGKRKLRLISDCRALNKFLNPPHFKLDHWKDIFPSLRKGMWAAKVDLKNAYFHLELSKKIKPYVRMQVGGNIYQMEGACFGLSTLPYWWTQVMSVFLKKWRKEGLLVFVYLDDILLLAHSKVLLEKHLHKLLLDLMESGMNINEKKSVLAPSQCVEHLGFTVNLKDGRLEVPTFKLKAVRKELGKFLTHQTMTCRKAAAILGQVRSCLAALPLLRTFTDHLVMFTNLCTSQG